MTLGELLFVAALWGVPLGLLWISWRRYSALHSTTNMNMPLARTALVLVSLSSGVWLFVYALVQIDDYSKMARSILNLGPTPGTLAVINLLVCAVALILSLLMPKTVQGTVPLQRSLIFATGYMVLVWMFALTAH